MGKVNLTWGLSGLVAVLAVVLMMAFTIKVNNAYSDWLKRRPGYRNYIRLLVAAAVGSLLFVAVNFLLFYLSRRWTVTPDRALAPVRGAACRLRGRPRIALPPPLTRRRPLHAGYANTFRRLHLEHLE